MPDRPPAQEQAGAPMLTPQPGPCQVFVSAVTLGDSTRAVMLSLVTTSATVTVFLPPESVAGIVADLQRQAQLARTGLLLAAGLPAGPSSPLRGGHGQ